MRHSPLTVARHGHASSRAQRLRALWPLCVLVGGLSCERTNQPASASDAARTADRDASAGPRLPLVLVADVPWPGGATRFDYQEVDTAQGHLVVAHMNDGAVVIANLSDGAVVAQLPGIPVVRGLAVADDVGIIFATSSPSQLVLIDNKALTEIRRITTGNGPDGVAWDPTHKVVGVSAQGDGALDLIANSGSGMRTQVPLGTETGNVVFDAGRGWFWITVVKASPPDQLVAVNPTTAKVVTSIGLPGCSGAHGLRLDPDGQSAFIACESNNMLAHVDLAGSHSVATGPTGSGPDVLSIDPSLGWLYVAAESGDLTVFDITHAGVALIGHDTPGSNSHSVAVDPATHRVFFPLMTGPQGTPTLRIMRPTGV
jgi:DNA-binding beta-propeller fold protein YncE